MLDYASINCAEWANVLVCGKSILSLPNPSFVVDNKKCKEKADLQEPIFDIRKE